MQLSYRKSKTEDIPFIMSVINEAQAYFKNKGIDQWQNGYPNDDSILCDITAGHSYVFLIDNRVIATAMISFDGETTYDLIDGKWLNNEPYAVVHRIAVCSGLKGKNIAGSILDIVRKLSEQNNICNIRVDTHRENLSMQRVLEKWGFTYCGIIYLKDGAERLAYQWCGDQI
ncbi:MAG: GNAT family N-acetyltransferase [Bacteroidales bacterium]